MREETKPNLKHNTRDGHLDEIEQLDEKLNDQTFALFVYGTLKRNFHWNHKFLSRGSEFIGNAKTIDKYPLVMGDCNVPYVLDLEEHKGIGHRIKGELWYIDYETLIGLDDYEGVHKGHYKRKKIGVTLMTDKDGYDEEKEMMIEAHIYVKADCQNIDLEQ